MVRDFMRYRKFIRLFSVGAIAIQLIFPDFARSEFINQPVVNIYLQPTEEASVNSQVIYGSFIEVIEHSSHWVKIKTLDEAIGWVKASQITPHVAFEESEEEVSVKNLFAHVYRVPDTTLFSPLLTLPYGAKVKLREYKQERWLSIELLSGEKAWIQYGDLEFSPRFKNLEEMIELSKKFLGLPYTWGGASSYGFDCSGFVQMLFKEMGFLIPRNSREQANSTLFIPVAREDLQPGDLIFFGETSINHVGLYLGNHTFIHSGVTELPLIMISDLRSGKYYYHTARRIRFPLSEKKRNEGIQLFPAKI